MAEPFGEEAQDLVSGAQRGLSVVVDEVGRDDAVSETANPATPVLP